MAQADRIYGHMFGEVTIGGTTYTLDCESFELSAEFDARPAVALRDTWEYPIGIRQR